MARKYTVQESNNLAIGQTPSQWVDSTDTHTPKANTVFIAIQCVNDVHFEATGLIAEDPLTCFSNGTGNVDNTHTGGTGDKVDADTAIPAGTILYGRWTSVKLNSGCCVLYVGG